MWGNSVSERTLTYTQLREAWFVISDVFRCPLKAWAANKCFCELLEQCGWSVSEWNAEVSARETTARKR